MTSGEIVGCIFLSTDKLFWMEELSVGSSSNFINDGGFKIKKNGSWNMLSSSGFGEKSIKSIISTSDGFIRWHLTVWLDSMLKAEKFPAGVT
jgi:hypothetical protein